MKTNSVPAIVMLLAGFIACIAGIRAHMDTAGFMCMLLIVLIVFYLLGCIIKMILDKYFAETQKEETTDVETPQEDDGENANGSMSDEGDSASDDDEEQDG